MTLLPESGFNFEPTVEPGRVVGAEGTILTPEMEDGLPPILDLVACRDSFGLSCSLDGLLDLGRETGVDVADAIRSTLSDP